MHRKNRTILSLVAVIVMLGSLSLLGCPGDEEDVEPATGADLANRAFAFTDGAVFGIPAITPGTVVTLSFSGANAQNFALTATVNNVARTARGTNTISSCILTCGPGTNPNAAGGGSNFPVGTGPQPGSTIPLDPCEFDRSNNTLIITNRNTGVTATSNPAVASGTGGAGN